MFRHQTFQKSERNSSYSKPVGLITLCFICPNIYSTNICGKLTIVRHCVTQLDHRNQHHRHSPGVYSSQFLKHTFNRRLSFCTRRTSLKPKYKLSPIFASVFQRPDIINSTHLEILKHSLYYNKRASFPNDGGGMKQSKIRDRRLHLRLLIWLYFALKSW